MNSNYDSPYLMQPCMCGHVRGDHVKASGICLQLPCSCPIYVPPITKGVDYDETTDDLLLEAIETIAEGMVAGSVTVTRGKVLSARSLLDQALNKMPEFKPETLEQAIAKGNEEYRKVTE